MTDSCRRPTAISRRRFVQGAVCAAAGTPLTGLSSVFALAQSALGNEVMREFPYGAVRLTGGPLMRHLDRIHAHYLALDNDRLLKVFRQTAGLPAPGLDMGGWYDADGFVPGLTLGQYISGLARLGAVHLRPLCLRRNVAAVPISRGRGALKAEESGRDGEQSWQKNGKWGAPL